MDAIWMEACQTGDLPREDVIRFDHAGRTFAVDRMVAGEFYATAGRCTPARVHLADGLVTDHVIECPKYNSRFDFTTGQAKGAPAGVDLPTDPVNVEADRVFRLLPP